MLSNLVGNAITFASEGAITVKADEPDSSGSGTKREFSVTDTGIGIPADKQALMFQTFSQVRQFQHAHLRSVAPEGSVHRAQAG